MKIIPVQQCRSLEGWMPIEIPSRTDPDLKYVVHTNPWGTASENICQCKSYLYRGRCAHQEFAHAEICGWNQAFSYEQQTDAQKKEMECPRCFGATMWCMEVEDD